MAVFVLTAMSPVLSLQTLMHQGNRCQTVMSEIVEWIWEALLTPQILCYRIHKCMFLCRNSNGNFFFRTCHILYVNRELFGTKCHCMVTGLNDTIFSFLQVLWKGLPASFPINYNYSGSQYYNWCSWQNQCCINWEGRLRIVIWWLHVSNKHLFVVWLLWLQ
jgi:hypothetical protein